MRDARARPPLKAVAAVWGVDLGATAAMSAVAAYWPESGGLEVAGGFPVYPVVLRSAGVTMVLETLYTSKMQGRGELITTEGRTVSVTELSGRRPRTDSACRLR